MTTQDSKQSDSPDDYSEEIDGPRVSRRRWLIGGGSVLAAGAAVTAFAVTRDGGEDKAAAGSAASDGTPKRGGELLFSDVGPITDLKFANYSVMNIFANLTDTLVYLNREGDFVPALAESWEVSDDLLAYTFVLRDGVTFSDGEPLTPEIVIGNLDLLAKGDADLGYPASASYRVYDSAEVVDERSLTVHLQEPDSSFLSAIATVSSGILSSSTIALPYEDQRNLEKIVGTGPFVFASQTPGEVITLERRDGYAWPHEGSTNPGEAYLDRVVIRNLPEIGLRANAVNSGQIHLAWGIQPSDEAVVTQAGSTVHAVQAASSAANYLAFRIGEAVVSDTKVRRALSIGFDRQQLVSSVLSDSYLPAQSFFGRTMRGFSDISTDLQEDLDTANSLLDEAGWSERDGDGFRVKDGQRLSVKTVSSNQRIGLKPSIEYLVEAWRENIGVEILSYAGDQTAFTASAEDSSYVLKGNSGGPHILFGPRQFAESHMYEDADLEVLLAAVRQAGDDASYDEAALALQRYIAVEQSLAIPLFDEVQVFGAGTGVHPEFNGSTTPQFQETWIE